MKDLKVKTILVSQPKPENDKSPYFDLAEKLKLKVDFRSFINVEGVPVLEFRKQKINLLNFEAVIFTSRNAVDHYFRMAEEMRITIPDAIPIPTAVLVLIPIPFPVSTPRVCPLQALFRLEHLASSSERRMNRLHRSLGELLLWTDLREQLTGPKRQLRRLACLCTRR